jgi:hypothetical protein
MSDQLIYNRRQWLRLAGGAGLALAVPLVGTNSASAIGWCRSDPVVQLTTPDELRKNTASVYVSALAEEYELNNSSADIVIEHPKDAKTKLLWVDPNGYFGQGASTNFKIDETLEFRTRYLDVRVKCYVPASRSTMKIRLEWAPGPITFVHGEPQPAPVIASVEGYANQWIALTSRLPY